MNEIEKKFLVKEIPDISQSQCKEITQGYINYDPEIRIRKSNDSYFLTQKGDGTLVRAELETGLTALGYEILCSKILNNLVEKQRYLVPLVDGNLAELDIYQGFLDGLMTVEVEFESEEQANTFKKPEWFGDDVTGDKRYKNKNLAKLQEEELSQFIPENKGMKLLKIK